MGRTHGRVWPYRAASPAAVPMRLAQALLLAVAFLAVSGCDAVSDTEPYAGLMYVGLWTLEENETVLRVEAENEPGCRVPLHYVVDESSAERLHVRVLGVGRQRPVTACAANYAPPSAEIALPFQAQGTFPIHVTHNGSTDEYQYNVGDAGATLEAVRTSTTRLRG